MKTIAVCLFVLAVGFAISECGGASLPAAHQRIKKAARSNVPKKSVPVAAAFRDAEPDKDGVTLGQQVIEESQHDDAPVQHEEEGAELTGSIASGGTTGEQGGILQTILSFLAAPFKWLMSLFTGGSKTTASSAVNNGVGNGAGNGTGNGVTQGTANSASVSVADTVKTDVQQQTANSGSVSVSGDSPK